MGLNVSAVAEWVEARIMYANAKQRAVEAAVADAVDGTPAELVAKGYGFSPKYIARLVEEALEDISVE